MREHTTIAHAITDFHPNVARYTVLLKYFSVKRSTNTATKFYKTIYGLNQREFPYGNDFIRLYTHSKFFAETIKWVWQKIVPQKNEIDLNTVSSVKSFLNSASQMKPFCFENNLIKQKQV